VTLEQIDAAPSEWENKLNHASANLLELDDLFAYKRLRGAAGDALMGITKDKVRPALAAMDHLWQSLSLLTDTLSRAQALRKSASRLRPSERALREIELILTAPSVSIPAAPAPPAQRALLSTADSTISITPQQLLSTMVGAFDAAKSTILAVDAAWNRLGPLLTDAEREAASLQALSEGMGEPTPRDLAAGRHKIDALCARRHRPSGRPDRLCRRASPEREKIRIRRPKAHTTHALWGRGWPFERLYRKRSKSSMNILLKPLILVELCWKIPKSIYHRPEKKYIEALTKSISHVIIWYLVLPLQGYF